MIKYLHESQDCTQKDNKVTQREPEEEDGVCCVVSGQHPKKGPVMVANNHVVKARTNKTLPEINTHQTVAYRTLADMKQHTQEG